MIWVVYAVLSILCFAVINRLRGYKEWKPYWMKGRPLYYMSGVVFLLALTALQWYVAAVFAVGYLIWGVFPWGRWYDMGALPDNYTGPPSAFEEAIEAISLGSDYVAMFWRHLFVAPCIVAVGWLVGYPLWVTLWAAMLFSIMVVYIYHICRVGYPKAHTIPAEYITGALWGVVYNLMWGYV